MITLFLLYIVNACAQNILLDEYKRVVDDIKGIDVNYLKENPTTTASVEKVIHDKLVEMMDGITHKLVENLSSLIVSTINKHLIIIFIIHLIHIIIVVAAIIFSRKKFKQK